MTTKIQKWGNSQGIRIPRYILDAVNWNEDETLTVKASEDKIVIERVERRKTIRELFDDFEGEYVPENVDWGEPVGREVW